jgi:hypothetical protein
MVAEIEGAIESRMHRKLNTCILSVLQARICELNMLPVAEASFGQFSKPTLLLQLYSATLFSVPREYEPSQPVVESKPEIPANLETSPLAPDKDTCDVNLPTSAESAADLPANFDAFGVWNAKARRKGPILAWRTHGVSGNPSWTIKGRSAESMTAPMLELKKSVEREAYLLFSGLSSATPDWTDQFESMDFHDGAKLYPFAPWFATAKRHLSGMTNEELMSLMFSANISVPQFSLETGKSMPTQDLRPRLKENRGRTLSKLSRRRLYAECYYQYVNMDSLQNAKTKEDYIQLFTV